MSEMVRLCLKDRGSQAGTNQESQTTRITFGSSNSDLPTQRFCNNLCFGVRMKLFINVLDMNPDGLQSDIKAAADHFVAQAVDKSDDNLFFFLCEGRFGISVGIQLEVTDDFPGNV